MKKIGMLVAFVIDISMVLVPLTNVSAAGGFDQFGYNDKANVFVGPADGVDRVLDGAVWGDPTYANDHLVMKWNEQWDLCNENGYDNPTFCAGAWTTNEYNGMNPDGTKSVWHYKIIWVGSSAEASPYWIEDGYSIWGNYELIQDFGFDPTGHYKFAFASPGLGHK